ncbi:hypothetical protein SVAN01_06909 [Stagonosporopsis vannaccii]|nr:hypothetical protein SVAN01_06909 [Stagonosporopsis vannaccii]
MIRVTTHVYPRLTHQSLPHYHYPSCTLRLPLSASWSDSVWFWFWFWFCFCLSAFVAWRSGSKIPFWHSFGLLLYH